LPVELSVPAVKTSLLLSAYRLASAAFGAMAPLYLFCRGKIGRGDFLRRHERLGLSYLARPNSGLALLYAASGVDALALMPLVEKLGQLGFRVLLSMRDLEADRVGPPRLVPLLCQLAPLDTPQSVKRLLEHWRPDLVLICGGELPPNFIFETRRRAIPLVLVNARMPARAFLFWRRFGGLAASLLASLDDGLVQREADAERLRALGLRSARVTGNLEYDVAPAPADPFALARLVARIGSRPAWVADGTALHENEIVIAAHRYLARKFPDILTVIVPHKPKHAFEIAQTAAKFGLIAGLGGADRETAPFPDLYIACSPGEAGLFYRAAGIIFAGRSLSDGSSKNPIAAARLGCAILHGPEAGEYEDLFTALDNSGGGMLVFDADTLAKQLALLIFDKAELDAMSRAAAETAKAFAGAAARTIDALMPYLAQVMVGSARDIHPQRRERAPTAGLDPFAGRRAPSCGLRDFGT
jgi:3-deoxy-D-manno-octulosonic-acid transferase